MTAAICFYLAHRREEGADYLRTSQAAMLVLGLVTAVAGVTLAPALFGEHPETVDPFRIAFTAAPVVFLGGTWVFALQGIRLSFWNAARVVQPLLYTVLILGLAVTGSMTVLKAILALVTSVIVQTALARHLRYKLVSARGRWRPELLSPLFRYGGANLVATSPYLVNSRLDQLVLALIVVPADFGRYAVAVSVSLS